MPDPVIPVVLLPEAPLSQKVLSYLGEVSSATGRSVFFMDLNRVRAVDPSIGPVVKARARADEDKPFIAILVDMKQITAKRYTPTRDDPVIAHEATHPLLESRGYPSLQTDSQPPEAQWAVQAIHNWLADPLINSQIFARGFDLSPDRSTEIAQSIRGMQEGKWAGRPIHDITRVAVSFLLEPNIQPELQHEFSTTLQRVIGPQRHAQVLAIVSIVKDYKTDQPQQYRRAASSLADYLRRKADVPLTPLTFAPPLRSFSRQEISQWLAENIVSTMKWP